MSNIHSHLWFLPLSTAEVIPQYWKISAFKGDVPLHDRRKLSKVSHTDEMLLRKAGSENDLRNISHTGFIKNNCIKLTVSDCAINDSLRNSGRNELCVLNGFFFFG